MVGQMALEQAAQAERERQLRIATAWRRYHGEWPEPLKKTVSDPKGEDNVRLNFAKLIVNKSVSYLFGYDLKFEVGEQPEGKKEQSESEKWLTACLDKNHRMTTLFELGINGGVSGQSFVRLHPPDKLRNGHEYPRIVVWDPGNVTYLTEPDDYKRVLEFRYTWNAIDPATGKPAIYRQVITRDGARWVILDQMSRLPMAAAGYGGLGQWQDLKETPWPYPWAPVVTCQNLICPNEWWGLADLEEDILAVNVAVNFTTSNVARILRHHAHPKTVAVGVVADQLKLGVDGTLCLPNKEARVENLEMTSDLTSSLEFARGLREVLHELSRIPEVATGKVQNLGQLSGVALGILFGPVVELTETKQLTYGELLDELGQRLLELGGKKPETVKPQWPQIVPGDPVAEANTALLHEQLGVSKNTLLSKLGYDPEKEAKKKAEEAKAGADLGNELLKNFDRGGPPPDNMPPGQPGAKGSQPQ